MIKSLLLTLSLYYEYDFAYEVVNGVCLAIATVWVPVSISCYFVNIRQRHLVSVVAMIIGIPFCATFTLPRNLIASIFRYGTDYYFPGALVYDS